jgi:hypothetical protein
LTLLTTTLSALGLASDTLVFRKGTLLLGIGLGTKSHIGNYGGTTNLFFTENFCFKLSIGAAPINHNGGILSAGAEYFKQIRESKSMLFGSNYSYSGGESDVINDGSSARKSYHISSGAQYIRTYSGIGLRVKEEFFKIEIGYSYRLQSPTYQLDGPGVWTVRQINKFE